MDLQKDGDPGYVTPYKYNKGKLTNHGNSLTKENGTASDLRSLMAPDIEGMIQGTWEYYDSETDFGERCAFSNGHYIYTSFMKKTKGVDRTTEGTYQIKDGKIYINSDYYFDYTTNGSDIELSITPDGGKDAGIPRIFQKIG